MDKVTRIVFDGLYVRLLDAKGRTVTQATAVSGRPLLQNPGFAKLKSNGPLPEGEYRIRKTDIQNRLSLRQPDNIGWMSPWGFHRVEILPDEGTELYGRKGFFLHGSTLGNGYGSAGCIDLNTEDGRIFDVLQEVGADDIELTVSYDDYLRSHRHPVFENRPDLLELETEAERRIREAVRLAPAAADDPDFKQGMSSVFGPERADTIVRGSGTDSAFAETLLREGPGLPNSLLKAPVAGWNDFTQRPVLQEKSAVPLDGLPLISGSSAIPKKELTGSGDPEGGLPPEAERPGLEDRSDLEPLRGGTLPQKPGGGEMQYARKSSYDTYRKLGRTPEEESQAMADYRALYRKSYLEVGGDEELADLVAAEWFKLEWGLSDFAPDAEGTVMKHPAEKVYPDLEKDGRRYVRKEVEMLLEKEGVRAAKWYLSPNGKTGVDFRKAPMDETGFGPRMSLTVEDEAGGRIEVTDSFQADMASARQRFLAARLKKDREEAVRYGIEVPPADAVRPKVRLEKSDLMTMPGSTSVPKPKPPSRPAP